MKRFLILLTLAAALLSCAKKVEISIIPQPASIEAGVGVYALDDDEIYIQPGIDPDGRLTKAVKEFAAQLEKVSEKDFQMYSYTPVGDRKKKDIDKEIGLD